MANREDSCGKREERMDKGSLRDDMVKMRCCTMTERRATEGTFVGGLGNRDGDSCPHAGLPFESGSFAFADSRATLQCARPHSHYTESDAEQRNVRW